MQGCDNWYINVLTGLHGADKNAELGKKLVLHSREGKQGTVQTFCWRLRSKSYGSIKSKCIRLEGKM